MPSYTIKISLRSNHPDNSVTEATLAYQQIQARDKKHFWDHAFNLIETNAQSHHFNPSAYKAGPLIVNYTGTNLYISFIQGTRLLEERSYSLLAADYYQRAKQSTVTWTIND